jgi:hypothetical protein
LKKAVIVVAALMIASILIVSANAAGSVTTGVASNIIPAGYGFIDFETGGADGEVIYSTIPGLQFTTTDGYDWVYVDVRAPGYNLKSLTYDIGPGPYVCNGYFCAWLGPTQSSGRIDFVTGPASYFSVLVTCNTVFTVDAYDSSDNLVATSGPAASNWGSETFSRCTVQTDTPIIAYVICHNAGNYWGIDDLVTNAPGVPNQVPEVPLGTVVVSCSMIVAIAAYVAIPRFARSRKMPSI